MKRLSKFGVVAGVIAAFAAVSVMAAEVTVGQFLVQIAKVKNVGAVDGESAVRGLQASGVNLSGLDLNKNLTEGDVARIASAVGVKVTTSQPQAAFSQRQADSFVRTFGTDLGSGGAADGPSTQGTTRPDPQPGKGKSKGHTKSPSEPV
jgi:hypothetical protein